MSERALTRPERRNLSARVRAAFIAQNGHRPKGTGFVRMASALAGRRMNRWKAWSWAIAWSLGLPERPLGFYDSEAWRKLRYRALRRSDGKCQLCGRSKADGVVLHVDHIKPRSLFPALALDLANLQVLCADCNLGKGNSDTKDWRQ